MTQVFGPFGYMWAHVLITKWLNYYKRVTFFSMLAPINCP